MNSTILRRSSAALGMVGALSIYGGAPIWFGGALGCLGLAGISASLVWSIVEAGRRD